MDITTERVLLIAEIDALMAKLQRRSLDLSVQIARLEVAQVETVAFIRRHEGMV
jgi:hypothetical protein